MGIVRHGVYSPLEDEANALLHDSLVGVTSMEAKRDILTPWKQKDRLDHEVYSPAGVPNAEARRGMYHRAWNPEMPHLNSRDGMTKGRRVPSSLDAFVTENGSGSFAPEPE